MANLRMLSLCALAGALLGLTASSAQTNPVVITPSTRIVSPVDDAQLVTLHGTVTPRAMQRNDLGAAPDGLQLERMHLVLRRSDAQEAALKQLIDEMHTPGSPNYHKWLTPDQFGAQFGPSDQDIAAVTTWLTTHGFSVRGINPGHQTIEISGSVAQLRNAFHTQIHQYSVNGQTHYSNANDPQIPAALAPVVGGFVSLNNFPVRSYAHSLGKAQYDPKTNQATPQWTMGTPGSLSLVLAPADYAVQYDLTAAAVNGSGQSIAIINESNINVDLVNQFRTLFSLSANPPQVIIDGNDPGVDGVNNPGGPNFASMEAYLDVEWAGAVAPSATIDLVIAADTALQNGLVLAAERAVYSNIAPIISISFGNCENSLGANNAFISSLWEQAAAQGITVTVSTGDAGSAGCDNDNAQSYAVAGQAVNGFASTPYNVAVGGTDFFYSQYAAGGTALSNQISTYWSTTPSNSAPAVSLLQPVPEQPWNSSQYGLNINSYYNAFQDTTIAGAGGGASNAAICSGNSYSSTTGLCTSSLSGYPKPVWQKGVTGIPADGVRDTPDVSLFASSGINASFFPVCASDGDCQPAGSSGIVQISGVGGTSASTPAFAGIMALVNQKYGRQGQANTVLYQLAAQFPSSFHDVTSGNISVPCEFAPTVTPNCIAVSSPIVLATQSGSITEGQIGTGTTAQYSAGAGYDLASGLGTVDAAQLVNNWNKVTLAASTTTMTATPANSIPLTSIPHGTSVTIAGTVTGSGTPTGDVALVTDNSEQSQQFTTKYTLSNGSYSGTTTTLPGGTYDIWAQYAGDSVNGLSTSAKSRITVTPEASAIDFNMFNGNNVFRPGSGPGTSVDYGTQLMLSALVAPSAQAAPLETCITSGTGCSTITFTAPTGVVAFADNGTALNTAALNNEGDAEYNAPFTVGAHSVTAAYAGDKSYSAATTTAPIAFTVIKDTPVFLLDASALATVGGNTSGINGPNQPLVITLQVLNGAQTNAATSSALFPVPVAPPTGTVTVSGLPSGVPTTAPLLAGVDPAGQGGTQAPQGVANFIVPAGTTSGTYNATFTYTGDLNYNATSGKFTLPIVNTTGAAQNSTITATISGTTTSPNAALTVTGTVTGTSTGAKAPTGSVFVYAAGYYIATFSVIAPSTGITSSFSGVLNSLSIPQGANQVTLQYSGDTVYNPSAFTLNSGNPISNPLADFSLIPASSNVPVTAGSSGTTAINLASVNGFAGTVNLTCTAAAGVTCSLPTPATLTNNGSTSATLTVNVPAGAATGNYNVRVTGTDASGMYIHTLAITAVVSGSSAPGFTLTSSQNINIAPGAATGNTSTISVNPTNGFTGSVALACAVTTIPTGATSPITCSILPTPVNIAGASPVASTLTVGSTATTSGGNYVITVTGTSGAITQSTTVNVAVSASTFSLSANPSSLSFAGGATSGNTSVITVSPSNGFTGSVALSCAATTIPAGATSPVTCAASPTPVNVNGSSATSTLTVSSTSSTTAGAYVVTVTGTSGSLTQTTTVSVTITAAGTFALSSSGSITITHGATTGNTSTIAVTPSGGFTGTVSLSCAISPTAANAPASCALNPSSVSITSGVQNSTLSISSTPTTALNEPLKLFLPATGGTVLALLFFFVPRRRRNWLAMMGLLIVLVSGIVIGCGGGSSSGGGGGNTGTTPGTYTVTVTGTSGAATKTTTVTLTIN